MGLFNLFSAEGRDRARAKAEYEECERSRRAALSSFRVNAMTEIMFEHPKAIIIMNRLDARFMALVEDEGTLLVGKFADLYYPHLRFVPHDANTSEFRSAVVEYKNSFGLGGSNIGRDSYPKFKNIKSWLSDRTTNNFEYKGYAVTGTADLEYMVGGSLFLNDTQIAKATKVAPKPKGYFGAVILRDVIENQEVRRGTQKLTFFTTDENPIGEGQKMGYEILFDYTIMGSDTKFRQEFLHSVVALRNFIYEMQAYYVPRLDKYDEYQTIEPDSWSVTSLDSTERDEDPSIESRYMF